MREAPQPLLACPLHDGASAHQRGDTQQYCERTTRDVRSKKDAETRTVPGGALSSIRGMSPPVQLLVPHPVTEIVTPPPCLIPCPGSPLATYDVVVALDSEWVE